MVSGGGVDSVGIHLVEWGWFGWGQGWDWFMWGMAGVRIKRGKGANIGRNGSAQLLKGTNIKIQLMSNIKKKQNYQFF